MIDIEAEFYQKYTVVKIREINGRYMWVRLPKANDNTSFETFDGILSSILNISVDGQGFPITRSRKRAKKWIFYAGTLNKTVILINFYFKYEDYIPIIAYAGENGFCVRYVNKEKTETLYRYSLPTLITENNNTYVFYENRVPRDANNVINCLGEPRASFTGLIEGKKLIINIPVIKTKDGQPLDNMPKIITTTNTETEIYDCSKNMRVNAIGKNGTLGNAYEEGVDFTFIDNKLTIHPKDNDEKWIVCYERTA